MSFVLRLGAGAAVIAVAMSGLPNIAIAQAVSPVPSVDLNRFAGSWYEIARLPTKREKGCISDVVDLVALADKADRLQLVNSCKTKNDYTDVNNAGIKAEKNSGDAKLKITYVWPFSDKVWILALGDNYEWVLLGSPNHKLLRVLSRQRTMSPEVLVTIRQKAASEGYAIDKLILTPQTQR